MLVMTELIHWRCKDLRKMTRLGDRRCHEAGVLLYDRLWLMRVEADSL